MITGNEPTSKTEKFVFGEPYITNGLTIRQYFAAMAMASDDYDVPYIEAYEGRAKYWVAKADALIAELNK